MMRKLIILLIFLFILIMPSALKSIANVDGHKKSISEQVIKESLSKTAILYHKLSLNKEEMVGVGVLLPDNIVATNWHVLYPYYYFKNFKTQSFKISINDKIYTKISLIGIDVVWDCAYLKIDTDDELPFFTSAPDYNIGDPIFCIGNPHNKIKHISYGQIRQVNMYTIAADYNFYDLFSHNAPLWYGSSGGPVVNQKGELVGINMGSNDVLILKKENMEYAEINIAISTYIIDYYLTLAKLHQREYNLFPPLKAIDHTFGFKIIESEIPDIKKGDIITHINGRDMKEFKRRYKISPVDLFDEVMKFSRGNGDWNFSIWRNLESNKPIQILNITVRIP